MSQPTHDRMRLSSRGAFTLIELLVVITIIAILAGLLLPVIAMVRDSARQVACMSNVRQVGMGMQFYAEDWGGRVPPVDDSGWGHRVTWMGAIHPYVDPGKRKSVIKGCPNYKAPPGNPHHGYAMNTNLDRPQRSSSNSRHSNGSPKWGSSYSEFWFAQISQASSRLLISERSGDNCLPGGGITVRHGDRANALFCDLHVEAVTAASGQVAIRNPLEYQ